MAIQAGSHAGQAVTLRTLDRANPLQLWVLQAQVGGGFGGAAFVNPSTMNSANTIGSGEDIVMQPFSPGSQDFDSWIPAAANQSGDIRIQLPRNNRQSWNDWGGNLRPGDSIKLWESTAANSVWRMVLAPVSTLESADEAPAIADEVPAIATEPAAV